MEKHLERMKVLIERLNNTKDKETRFEIIEELGDRYHIICLLEPDYLKQTV